jgi:hypothetical protein
VEQETYTLQESYCAKQEKKLYSAPREGHQFSVSYIINSFGNLPSIEMLTKRYQTALIGNQNLNTFVS